MNLIDTKFEDGKLTIFLKGHIDSKNAPDVEAEVVAARAENPGDAVVIDCRDLEYISSAGLRIILRLRKECANLKLVEVSSEVYEVFDMTGFTEMVDIEKAYRVISVEGCEVIGEGANGKVYRIDPDTIVKVYVNPDSLSEIQHERELARTAFVLGVPTAIPYDVVRVGDSYGSVFELLNAKSFAQLLVSGEKSFEEIAQMSIELLKQIHSVEVKEGSMPSEREVVMGWAEDMRDELGPEIGGKLCDLVAAVPEDMHMMHGDYHIKNVMLQNGESLLIDMDTLCHGHPVFELANMYNAYQGFGETDHEISGSFLGLPFEEAVAFWERLLHLYLGDVSEEKFEEVREKAMIVGNLRLMRRTIRREPDTPRGQAIIENSRKHLMELVPKYDTLLF